MYTANFPEKQALGLHKLTGDNSGEVFTNEREVKVTDPETRKSARSISMTSTRCQTPATRTR